MNSKSSLSKIREICEKLDENEPKKNKYFYSISSHGYETEEDYIVPKGIRIIMFCYSGELLHMCPKFDRFIWKNILLNEEASYNYCTFLTNLTLYPSLRDHFCVYDSGHKIKNMVFDQDEEFRSGIFKLPVECAVYDNMSDTIYTSSSEAMVKILERDVKKKRISVNTEKTGELIRYKQNEAIIFSQTKMLTMNKLSDIARNVNDSTILLLTCREGKKSNIHPARRVYQELEKLYTEYSLKR
jgi:hypothetical protein